MSQRIVEAKAKLGIELRKWELSSGDEPATATFARNCVPTIIGLCTDSRNPKRTYLEAKNELMSKEDYESQYCYVNLFTVGCIKVNGHLSTSVDELLDMMEAYISERNKY